MDRAPIERIRQIAARLPRVELPGADDAARGAASGRGPPGPDELALQFAARLDALRGPGDGEPAVVRVAGPAEAVAVVRELLGGARRDEVHWFGDSPDPPCDRPFGVTPALALIADTGSVVVDLPGRAGGVSSLLVDTHIVVCDESCLVGDLAEFYAALPAWRASGRAGGYQVCISGCSRTADIEKLLVVPAHGPRRLRVVLSRTTLEWTALREAVLAAE
ncbi:MAG: LUD domain-containing protein [Phycisphaerae bacterium]